MDDVNQQLGEVSNKLEVCLAALNRYDDDSHFRNHKSFRYLKDDTHDQRKETLKKEKERLENQKERLQKEQLLQTELLLLQQKPSPLELAGSVANAPQRDRKNDGKMLTARDKMKPFFDADVKHLQLDSEGFIAVQRMGWFDIEIEKVYWRSCYSYILCSTIAFFENAYKDYTTEGMTPEKRSMVLTGVQGTGKSILGSFIGLVMGRAFGWQVTYIFGDMEYQFGETNSDNDKQIEIYDLSHGEKYLGHAAFKFVVSSANSNRWHHVAQQQSWNPFFGNYCYMDTATEEEIGAMMEGIKWTDSFQFAGGVPRLCRTDPSTVQRSIDSALKMDEIHRLVARLSQLQDSVSADGQKLYPGLVGHIVPTNKFRNEFKVQPASGYVLKSLKTVDGINTDKKHEALLNKMLVNRTARSFAGWLWKALFAKKCIQGKSRITVVGSKLPYGDQSEVRTLLQVETTSVATFYFDSFECFKKKAKDFSTRTDDFCVIAKAQSDTFKALDAILMQRQGNDILIAGLQLTVADQSHPVNQSAMVKFSETCHNIDKEATVQLWFLQPEKSLSYSQFTSLQPVVFDQSTSPSTGNHAVGATAPRKRRKRSNDRNYWDERIKSLHQLVGIVRLEDNVSGSFLETSAADLKFKESVSKALLASSRTDKGIIYDPLQRSFDKTMAVMESLEQSLDQSLYKKICSDIADDKHDLEVEGFVFPGMEIEE